MTTFRDAYRILKDTMRHDHQKHDPAGNVDAFVEGKINAMTLFEFLEELESIAAYEDREP